MRVQNYNFVLVKTENVKSLPNYSTHNSSKTFMAHQVLDMREQILGDLVDSNSIGNGNQLGVRIILDLFLKILVEFMRSLNCNATVVNIKIQFWNFLIFIGSMNLGFKSLQNRKNF